MPTTVDSERLWDRLMMMAEVGATSRGGSNRQALSDEDAAGRALLLDWAHAAGCTSETDQIGNLFVRRAGRDDSADPVLVGSHLDTQPTGGRFDGVLGVLGGLEVIESLNDGQIDTDRPVELVVWTNEEGSRFQHSMMGSAVWSGKLDREKAFELTDEDGVTVAGELERLGWAGERPAEPTRYAAAFELHIEQGPILETDSLEVGVVTGVQGLRWYTIVLTGEPAHAGPTPMEERRDPAAAIARVIDSVYATTAEHAPWGRSTFAQFRSEPTSPNTVPRRLTCTLDLRHPDLASLDAMEANLREVLTAQSEHGVGAELTCENDSPPVAFDEVCISAVQSAVDELGLTNRRMVSGAGHDSCYVAAHCPTSMIFVPCEGGVSHNESESITPEQAANGANVLLGAVKRTAGAAA